MRSKKWHIRPPAPADHLARFPDLPPLVVQILYNRGITEPHEVRAFLAEEFREENPFRLKGMNEAVARLRYAIRAGEPIAIYGDFDVDGVTATALLVQVLTALGARARPYIPHRVDEGYGLNCDALRELANRGVKVVVTVDCGVRSVEEIAYGRRLGLDIVVTDHHAVPQELPPALAVIDPRRPDCRYPFKDLPGVGLAFKLAQALLRVQKRVPLPGQRWEVTEENLLDLVALGAVTDLSPLVGENRALVRRGLEVLNQAQRVGLRGLMQTAGVEPGRVNTETISYVLGPRLNAAGRLDHAMASFRLLMSQTEEEAAELARDLEEKNRRRQQLTIEMLERARQEVVDLVPEEKLLFVAGRDYLAGIVGLVASRLTEEFYRPAVVVELGDKESRGSARSIPELNIVAALDECQDLLTKHGGHAAAAGFTVSNANLEPLRVRLRDIAARQLRDVDLTPTLDIDVEVPLAEVNWATHALISELAPFGQANPAPLLLSRGVAVRDHRLVGENHLKLTLDDGRVVWDAIAFGQGAWAEALPSRVDIVYSLEVNEWRKGERWLQLNVKDLRASEG
ncbi:MAG: single-stranded-DNA-specific exonuclease RecJ [Anaerolineae bacterium]